MTNAGLADVLTILIAAILSFTLVDLIRRKRNARIYLFFAGLWSMARLSLGFGPARARAPNASAADPEAGKGSRQVKRQARRARRRGASGRGLAQREGNLRRA